MLMALLVVTSIYFMVALIRYHVLTFCVIAERSRLLICVQSVFPSCLGCK